MRMPFKREVVRYVEDVTDGRAASMVRVSPRKWRVIVESAPVHETDGIKFVHCLFSREYSKEAEAVEKYHEFAYSFQKFNPV